MQDILKGLQEETFIIKQFFLEHQSADEQYT